MHAAKIIEIIAVAGTCCSVAYYLICLYSASAFLRYRQVVSTIYPPISILKPLKGTDPEMYESFRSHCLQDYPVYEIIFGVSEPDDPAIALVQRLQSEFPARNIQLRLCEKKLGPNIKVSNLVQMAGAAAHEIFVVNDSDIRVPADYLKRAVAPLADSAVGLVTCLYRAVGARTLGSRLEAIAISTDFCPGVLVARLLQGVRFGLGSTLALRRSTLDEIGGFEALLDYLADDYEVGARISDNGFKVELADCVVETYLPAYRFSDFLRHQIRWARTIRDSRPAGYVGLVFTFGLAWSLLALLASGGAAWAWGLLAVTLAARFLVALVVGRSVLKDAELMSSFWLCPLRDLLAVAIWVASFAGHTIAWRGDSFVLRKGKLARI